MTRDFDSSRSFTIGANGGTILTTKGDGAFDAKISGVISGSGKLTFDGGKFIDLLNNNTYTGPTVINNAGVTLHRGPICRSRWSVVGHVVDHDQCLRWASGRFSCL